MMHRLGRRAGFTVSRKAFADKGRITGHSGRAAIAAAIPAAQRERVRMGKKSTALGARLKAGQEVTDYAAAALLRVVSAASAHTVDGDAR
jgi:hypothetical protein